MAVLVASSAVPSGRAANPQPYSVEIAPTGQAPLDAAVQGSSMLISLRESAPVGPFALIGRARADAQRLAQALQSYGYYDGRVSITIAGRPLDDPELTTTLDATPQGKSVPVRVTLERGPLFHLRHVTLQGQVPPVANQALQLAPGQPALAADVLAAHDRLLKALQDNGYALAKVSEPSATLVPAAKALDVAFQVEAGPRVDLGPIAIKGLKQSNESFVRERLLIHPGELYDPAKIEAARQDLADIGIFSTVRIAGADRLDPQGRLPMTVEVSERPLRVVDLSAAYSTDLGIMLSASWTHRNLFGNAERLTLSAAVTGIGGSATNQPGYNAGATFTVPDWQRRGQTLSLSALAVREYLLAYDRTALVANATVSRRIDRDLTVSLGLTGEEAVITQEGVERTYTLLQVPIGLQYDSTHNLLDPVRGFRAAATVTPTESFSHTDATFAILQASGSAYFDLLGNGRTVLATRALVGSVQGASTFDIPPDQRFYAGGGGTVRGFRYQSIGPQFPSGVPTGGTSIDAGSVELRQRFGTSYGAVLFADAGSVGTGGVPFEGKTQVGVGIGARYYTSFGPLRLDVAVPVTHQPSNDNFQVYIGIGQAF